MTDFNPFSDSGKAWLEENKVEDQYETLENVGFCITRVHRSKHNIKKKTKDSIIEKEKTKDIIKK